ASLISVLVEFVIYATLATAGYLSFRGGTEQDFIRNYPADDWWMLVVRCLYSVPVVFGVPINLAPAAASMMALAGHWSPAFARQRSGSSAELPSGAWWSRVAVLALALGSCALVALCSEAFADVIGLFGACFGTLICLVWPLMIYIKVMKNLHSRALSTVIIAALIGAALLGMAAFVEQFFSFVS
ncbi:unnamed protein product, partial [Effrenium voratum]